MPRCRLTAEDNIRVPGDSTYVRDGTYVGPGVVCMPPVLSALEDDVFYVSTSEVVPGV
jgi:hypothetical protein